VTNHQIKNIDGVSYVRCKVAAPSAGISAEYISRLCREGHVLGRQIDGSWHVNEDSLKLFLEKNENEKKIWREEQAKKRRQEQHDAGFIPRAATATLHSVIVTELPRIRVAPRALHVHHAQIAVQGKRVRRTRQLATTAIALFVVFSSLFGTGARAVRGEFAAAGAALSPMQAIASGIYLTFCGYIGDCGKGTVLVENPVAKPRTTLAVVPVTPSKTLTIVAPP
jgi:hypothetical protein